MEKLSNATAMDSSMRFHCVKTNEVRDEERKKRAFFFPSSIKRQERERVYKGRNCLLFFFSLLYSSRSHVVPLPSINL